MGSCFFAGGTGPLVASQGAGVVTGPRLLTAGCAGTAGLTCTHDWLGSQSHAGMTPL